MNEEKRIEEMTKVIDQAKYDMWVGKAHQSGDFTNHSKNIAKALYKADYRKATDVAREVFEEIEKNMVAIDDIDFNHFRAIGRRTFAELQKKYTEGGNG